MIYFRETSNDKLKIDQIWNQLKSFSEYLN